MKWSVSRIAIGFMLMVVLPTVASAADLIVSDTLQITAPATYDNVIVQSAGLLIVDAPLTVLGDMRIESGGVVTHTLRYEAGLVLDVADTLEVRVGGMIDVSAKGLRGGNRGLFGVNGEAYDETGQIVSGAVGGTYNGTAGASYGGRGWGSEVRPTNEPYGKVEEPVWLGSGGAGGVVNSGWGGSGGGRVTIDAGVLIVDGAIRSNGGNGEPGGNGTGAAGSGGSVLLRVGSLSGGGTVEAIGGMGFRYWAGALGGGGGGGRIAISYDMSAFSEERIVACGGMTAGTPVEAAYYGGAGTIYLKDNAEAYGRLIVDNQAIGSRALTPLRTDQTSIPDIRIRNNGHLEIPSEERADFGTVDSGEIISLESGALTCPDTLKINSGGLIDGTGAIYSNVVNSGVLSSSSGTGRLSIIGSYHQMGLGILEADIAGLSDYDHLHVEGAVGFDGRLAVTFLNGFTPPLESRYALVSFTSHAGTFSEVTGIDTIATVAYQDTLAFLIEGRDYTAYSTFDPVLIISPVGTPSFHVVLRDDNNQPVAGSTNAWLDLSAVSGLTGCSPPQKTVNPVGPSDANGELAFSAKAAGCTSDSAAVMTAHGMLGRIPIRSLDHNGGLRVSALDFVGDLCNDYNIDGVVDEKDWEFFSRYLGQTCLSGPAQYFVVNLYTKPGPDRLFVGDTISVCTRVVNTVNEPAVLDHVIFTTAGWGIAMPWTEIAHLQDVAIGPLESIELCTPFVIPADQPRHGCYRVSVTPLFTAGTAAHSDLPITAMLAKDVSSPERNDLGMYAWPSSGDKQINVDSRQRGCNPNPTTDRDGDGVGNEYDQCNSTPCGCEIDALGCARGRGVSTAGKACPRESIRPYALESSARRMGGRLADSLTTGTNTTRIPLGGASGSQLYLYHRAFLPDGWSYAISDTGWVTTPDTVTIDITHPVPVLCGDTARVVIYAYTPDETYAGDAEATLYALGQPGDVDFSYSVDTADVRQMTECLVQLNPSLPNVDGMEANGDGLIDIGDLTRMVDNVFAGGSLECMSAAPIDAYDLRYGQRHDTTFVLLDENRPIRGMQLLLVGQGSDNLVSLVSPEVELVGFRTGDTLSVLMADLNGSVPIAGSIGFAVPGLYTVTEGRVASLEHHSGDVEIRMVTSVLVSTFEAEPSYGSITVRWEIQSDEQVRGFKLYRKDEQEDMFSTIASESELSGEHRSYVDSDVRGGHTYEYALGVLKTDGTEVLSQFVQVVAKKFELTLFQNHPNPFNPTTTISFVLPHKMRVHLAIYDVAGRLVKTLVRESLEEGLHVAKWAGQNNNGSQVSSGVYFYRLVAGKRTLTKKMVLLR